MPQLVSCTSRGIGSEPPGLPSQAHSSPRPPNRREGSSSDVMWETIHLTNGDSQCSIAEIDRSLNSRPWNLPNRTPSVLGFFAFPVHLRRARPSLPEETQELILRSVSMSDNHFNCFVYRLRPPAARRPGQRDSQNALDTITNVPETPPRKVHL